MATLNRAECCPSSAKPLSLRRGMNALVDLLFLWQERSRQRHELLSMDRRMLRDLGLSRQDIEAEIAKPFWQA